MLALSSGEFSSLHHGRSRKGRVGRYPWRGRYDAAGKEGGRVIGVLPAGWRENSSQGTVWVRYSTGTDGAIRFFRMEVVKLEAGYGRLYHALPPIEQDFICRLRFKARAHRSMSLRIGVRLLGKPYKWVKVLTPLLRQSWRDFAYDFVLPKDDRRVGLFIRVPSVGQIDFAHIRLEALSRQDLIDELNAKYPDGGPKNLLRNSRFPLGLQSGWSLSQAFSDGDDVQIASDPAVKGPSLPATPGTAQAGGAPSMRIHAPNGVISTYGSLDMAEITTAPFSVPLSFMPHTASVYVRGSCTGKMVVFAEGRSSLGETSFELRGGDGWRRVAVTFRPKFMAKFHAIKIAVKGTLWLDAMQVAPGETVSPYTSWMPCEVALACPPGDAAQARIQFDDEPAVVRYAVTGAQAGSVLRAKVVNVYGEEKGLRPVRLNDEFLQEGDLRYDVFRDRPYGPFRIEAWVEDAKGERISTFNELVINRLLRPRYWGQDAPDSPFGAHTHSTTRHLLMAKAVGINWVRLHDAGIQYLGWFFLEGERGKWTFRDSAIRRYRKYGLKILGELGTAPDWASYARNCTGRLLPASKTITRKYFLPLDIADYASYVRVVTARYKGVIDTYGVWNEPWLPIFFSVDFVRSLPKSRRYASFAGGWYVSSDTPWDDFICLQRAAREATRAVSKDIRILGFGATTSKGGEGRVPGQEWTRSILDRGGMESCDVIGYHDYADRGLLGCPGDAVEDGYRWALDPVLKRYGGKPPKPVWMSEGSPLARSASRSGFYNHTLTWQDGEDVIGTSDRIARFVTSLLAQGVEKVFLYSMGTHRYFGSPAHRVLVTEEGYLHPCGSAHSALAWHLEDTSFVETMTVAEHVHAFIFQGKGRAVAVLAKEPGQDSDYLLPHERGLETRDLFGNPVKDGEMIGQTVVYVSLKGDADGLRSILTHRGN